MSGDSQRNDDPDFLDDDFIVEDLAGKNDDLDQLFDVPAGTKAAPPGAKRAAGAAPDSEDVLFTDHTGAEASEHFPAGEPFAEQAKTTWRGDNLELDDERPAKAGAVDKLAAAEAAFTEELGSILQNDQNDEDLALDSEKELELVDGPSATAASGDGVSEFDQSGPFVLDDGEAAWHDQESPRAPQPVVEPEVAEGIWEAVEEPAMAEHADDQAAIDEPGWEKLPESNVDQLSEVGEVERAEELPADPDELAEHEGHDIYSDDQAPVLVGPRKAAGRFQLVAGLAASLALVGGAAVVVMRPEWVGVQIDPLRVQQVQIARPRIELVVAAPPAMHAVTPQVGQVNTPTGNANQTPAAKDPVAAVPAPTTPDPVATSPDPVASAPEAQTVPAMPVAMPPIASWPVATPAQKPTAGSKPRSGALVRIGDDTMLGDADPATRGRGHAVEGVAPGARAFAQLHNGNYFIGSIKGADANRVTLRVNEGEVTLETVDIARMTALGSVDYDALQKATSGFVRLTNSNRLVGAILSQIADDHIVLEFRSNRIILPRSAVGEVVQGDGELGVRLDVTREEDDWVRNLAERQLGQPAEPKRSTAVPTPGAKPTPGAAPTPAPTPTPGAAPMPTGRQH